MSTEREAHEASTHLRRLARQIVDAARARVPLRAALLAGSAGRGDSDFYSDIDLLVYVDEVPSEDVLQEIRETIGGINPVWRGEPTEHFCGTEFELDGVRTEVSFCTVVRVEWQLEELLDRLEAVGSPLQKILSGLMEGLPLYGEELIESWQARLRAYAEPLRRAMIERHWNFYPLWYHGDAIAARDAELWRIDALLDGAFNLLAVLAGLNRLYFARFQFKGLRAFVAKMELAPPRVAERLEALFRLAPEDAAAELGRLVEETRTLVHREFPEMELPLRLSPATRQKPWTAE
jgi:predicted nucleotidyltransferase